MREKRKGEKVLKECEEKEEGQNPKVQRWWGETSVAFSIPSGIPLPPSPPPLAAAAGCFWGSLLLLSIAEINGDCPPPPLYSDAGGGAFPARRQCQCSVESCCFCLRFRSQGRIV